MTTTLEILRAARAKIERPECWTKGELARDAAGNSVTPDSAEAVCWCPVGAIHASTLIGHERFCARHVIVNAIDSLNIGGWNDAPERTHAEVLAAFDAAIAAEASK